MMATGRDNPAPVSTGIIAARLILRWPWLALRKILRRFEKGLKRRRPAEGRSPLSCTVCIIVKDEMTYILEWIAYYEIIGFDRIIFYDNNSSDGTTDILLSLANIGRINYVSWPDVPGVVTQYAAYRDALTRISTEWVAFLDIDEFLLLKSHLCMTDFLRSFPPTVGGIAVNWKMFGSSGHRTRTQGLVIERFTKCANLDHGRYANSEYGFGWQIKSIVRLRALESVDYHFHVLKEPFSYVNSVGQAYVERSVCYEGAQVNHYAVKSWEEFLEKTKKSRVNFTPEKNAQDEYWEHDLTEYSGYSEYFDVYDINSLDDVSMLRYEEIVSKRVVELKRILGIV
jgi:Glycosyltransferase family 92